VLVVEKNFSSVNAAYNTMHQIGYWQLEGAINSQRDGFMRRWWMCKRGTML